MTDEEPMSGYHKEQTMTHTIWKYEIPVEDEFMLRLPRGAQFLSAQAQSGTPQSWWLVDSTAPMQKRHFRCHGTGHPVKSADGLAYLGTFQISGGSLVFHLFEIVQAVMA